MRVKKTVALKMFIENYTGELRTLLGQIPSDLWILFPDFFYQPYIIRASQCTNGVAILFRRKAKRESITVRDSKKRAEEVFLPYLPRPTYSAIFGWTKATRFALRRELDLHACLLVVYFVPGASSPMKNP